MIDFDLGTVTMTTIPTAGYVTTLSAIVGHGYVVEDNARHWRVFVTTRPLPDLLKLR